MKTCVTGGAGFIGSHLVDRLLDNGHEVVVLDDLSTGSLDNLVAAAGRFTLCQGDVRDAQAVADAVAGCDVVYHLAALASVARSLSEPESVHDVNVTGTLTVLNEARRAGVKRVVFASSSSVYGDTPTLPKHPAMPSLPRSPYAATKAAGESYCAAFYASFGLETVALRFFNVYGPRQSAASLYAAVVPLFFDAMSAGQAPVIHGDGGQTRDFTFVSDTVAAIASAGTAVDAAGKILNIGGGARISIAQLARGIAAEVGFEGSPIFEAPRVGDVRDSLADLEDTCRVLDWAPQVPVLEGLRRIQAVRRRTRAAEPRTYSRSVR